MEHFYHSCCSPKKEKIRRRRKKRKGEKKDKHLSAISCCLLNITKGPCVGPNVPKMKKGLKLEQEQEQQQGRRQRGHVHSSAAGPGRLRAMLLFCPLFPFISPFRFFPFFSLVLCLCLLPLSYFWPRP